MSTVQRAYLKGVGQQTLFLRVTQGQGSAIFTIWTLIANQQKREEHGGWHTGVLTGQAGNGVQQIQSCFTRWNSKDPERTRKH